MNAKKTNAKVNMKTTLLDVSHVSDLPRRNANNGIGDVSATHEMLLGQSLNSTSATDSALLAGKTIQLIVRTGAGRPRLKLLRALQSDCVHYMRREEEDKTADMSQWLESSSPKHRTSFL